MSHLEVHSLSKAFGGVQAVSDATFSAERGTIHGLCGANGAGKSTLIRMLAGATWPDAGQITLAGGVIREFTPQHSTSLGIGVVYQELALIPELPVLKNIFLGIEQHRGPLPRNRDMIAQSKDILGRMGVDLDVNTRVADLGLHQQQIVEIAKALCRGSSLLILDEPTAILNGDEKRQLFQVLKELRRSGLCIIFITHFIDELFEVCDRLTVMRDGRTVATWPVAETNRAEVVFAMVGAVADHKPAPLPQDTREVAVSAHAARVARKFANLDFAVREGEIVGLAGLVGSGCYEAAEALFGLRQLDGGEIRLAGRPIRLTGPRDAVRAGIGYIPENRRTKGLCLNLTSSVNTALPSLRDRRFSRHGVVKAGAIRRRFLDLARRLHLHPPDPSLPAGSFSGGNQQKLVIGKWVEKGCRIYIFVEPTRGVDVGAKVEIWRTVEQLGRDGAAVILVSTDFDDIAAVCSRCLVFSAGRIAGELVRPDISPNNITSLAVGGPRPAITDVLQ